MDQPLLLPADPPGLRTVRRCSALGRAGCLGLWCLVALGLGLPAAAGAEPVATSAASPHAPPATADDVAPAGHGVAQPGLAVPGTEQPVSQPHGGAGPTPSPGPGAGASPRAAAPAAVPASPPPAKPTRWSDAGMQVKAIAEGVASYYANYFSGRSTANGERFDQRALTMAHRSLPFGTLVRVVCLRTERSVVVRVNDRGPFVGGRVADLSRAAAEQLNMVGTGLTKVRLEVLGHGHGNPAGAPAPSAKAEPPARR